MMLEEVMKPHSSDLGVNVRVEPPLFPDIMDRKLKFLTFSIEFRQDKYSAHNKTHFISTSTFAKSVADDILNTKGRSSSDVCR